VAGEPQGPLLGPWCEGRREGMHQVRVRVASWSVSVLNLFWEKGSILMDTLCIEIKTIGVLDLKLNGLFYV